MNQLLRRSVLTLALVVTLAAVALAPADGATTQAPHVDPPATYTTTIVVDDLDADGHVVASHTITGEPRPLGTRQTIKGSPRPFLDTGVGGLPSASGCRALTVTNKTTTTLGFTAFKFITEVHWCWNLAKGRTTLSSVEVRVANVDSQYRYRGVVNAFNQTISHGKRVYRQGHFDNCITHYGCINAYYPSNDSRVYDSGMWSWTTNG
ncbi:MAG TPA: hypothetical protein VFV89_03920 [Nocardioides sp.]|uniref:hypothetical protein n=1 Tax=Nocardioides sp. TaxID=35761 RepID=UPI002E37391F|nr:hypothetical protein [Nocardioides sp.]HEX5086930.1 hypothetical protein [Nocardioides sp.]